MSEEKNVNVLTAFPPSMIAGIEKYWHDKKLPSRSEAIRQLIDIALKQESSK